MLSYDSNPGFIGPLHEGATIYNRIITLVDDINPDESTNDWKLRMIAKACMYFLNTSNDPFKKLFDKYIDRNKENISRAIRKFTISVSGVDDDALLINQMVYYGVELPNNWVSESLMRQKLCKP